MFNTASVVHTPHLLSEESARPATQGESADKGPIPYTGWNAALRRLQTTLGKRESAVLVGTSGVGKTTMLAMLDAMGQAGARVSWRRTSSPVLVDDAQALSADEVDTLLQSNTGVVLAGQHGLVERLGSRRRPVTIVELPPVQPVEYSQFMHAMLDRAGEPATLLSPGVIATIGRHAGGNAGSMVALARLSIFLARLEGADTVQSRHIEEATAVSSEVDLPEVDDRFTAPAITHHPRRRVARVVALVTAGLCAVPMQWMAAPQPQVSRVTAPTIVPATVVLPALPPPTPMPPLPKAVGRVTILVPDNDPEASARGEELASRLRKAGFAVPAPLVVTGPLPEPGVRYFYRQDAAAAKLVAATFADDSAPLLASGPPRGNPPRPGSAEVTLAPTEPSRAQNSQIDRRRAP